MKKNLLKFGFSVLAAFTLAACSSGGGNDGDPVPQANNNAVQTQTSSNQNQTGQDNTNQPSTAAAVAYTTSGKKLSASDSGINSIVVNGQTLRLVHPNLYAGTWQNLNGQNVCCGKFSDVRVGASKVNGEDVVFYTGNATQSMPNNGVATYKGYAAIRDASGLHTASAENTAVFTADFAAKKLTGSFTADSKTVNVDAAIDGNGFSGTANSAQLGQGKAEGKFYGNNAKELGGLAQGNDNSWSAVFAAQQ